MITVPALVAPQSDLALAGPLGSLDAYIDRVSRIPVLSREEEHDLAVRYRSEDDLDAARKLVLSLIGAEDPRMDCLYASWMAHTGSFHIEWGLSHQMGRQLGPHFGSPHGHASAGLRPAVIELQRPRTFEAEACIAEAIGVNSGVAGPALRRLARELCLPTTLREARDLFHTSEVARTAFGVDVVDHYLHAADVELDAFESAVTDWERARGFERL